MKKHLFVHIGSHKTATTFLQNTFAINQVELDRFGILYPRAARAFGAHHHLAWSLRNPEMASANLTQLDHWSAVIEEIEASPHQKALVSTEDLEWIVDISRLAVLSDKFDVSVVFYLRSPDSYLESYYNQLVKDFKSRETRTLEGYIAESSMFFLDTSIILNRWARVFGKDAIKLRLFGRKHITDGIEHDFLRVMGVPESPNFAPAKESILQKTSLPPDALDYLRLCNLHLSQNNRHHDFVVQLVQTANANVSSLQSTRAGLLSLAAKRNVLRRFQATNKQSVATYLGIEHTPFPVADAVAHMDYDSRLPAATAEVMAKVAAMVRIETSLPSRSSTRKAAKK